MEKLNATQLESIKKMSQARLILKLSKAGYSEEDLEKMDRQTLANAWAECVVAGRESVSLAPLPTPLGYDVTLERQKFEFEVRKYKAQENARREELDRQENIRLEELQRQDRIHQEDIDRQERYQRAEGDRLKQKEDRDRAEKETRVNRAKRFSDAIKASLAPMGPDVMEMVAFSRHLEAVYARYSVPADVQADLLQPYLNIKSRSIVGRMDPNTCHDYKTLRDTILKEHKLTPSKYLDYFNRGKQSDGETCVMFNARLKALLQQYTLSRNVSDYDRLMSLIVSDRIKSTLSENCLRHIFNN